MVTSIRDREVVTPSDRWQLLDGTLVAGDGDPLKVVYPATSEVLQEARGASVTQVDRAVHAARRAFDGSGWRDVAGSERAARLDAMADHLEARSDQLATLVVADNGKTLPEAAVDVRAAIGALRNGAAWAREDHDEHLDDHEGVRRTIVREPVGVVAALTPFNAPLMFCALKTAAALASGNTLVLKPSERAPLVPVALAEAAVAAGLPGGVLGLVQGDARVAAALVEDARVDAVSLTGGVPAGVAVARTVAGRIGRMVLELGGKSANIVLADADLEPAIAAAAAGIYRNSGQRCFSGSRLVVEESIADEVTDGVVELARTLRQGDPFEPTTQVGALIDQRAVGQVTDFVARAVADDGVRVAAGGAPDRDLEPGSFYRPTVLTGVEGDCHAAQEEVFGPVLSIIRVRDVDEAVRVANDSRYGLAGAVWSRDEERAVVVARRLRTGLVWVNTYGSIQPGVPFGGFRTSGIGREGGRFSFEGLTELKALVVDTTGGSSAARL